MADPQKTPRSASRRQRLPALERLAPTPDAARLAVQIQAHSSPGDVVLELHGRGGWVARSAIDDLRRAFAIESSALTRLVAEIVLRPPDLRHFDAAVSAIAVDARGTEGGLRHAIEAGYASRCVACDGPVNVAEFIWETEATDPSRKSYECKRCRTGRGDARPVAVGPDDLYLARSIDRDAARAALSARFPAPSPEHPLPAELVDLYSPRAQVALAAILDRIESEARSPSVQAALRLAIAHMAVAVSSLNGYPGRPSQLRIANGHIRRPSSRQWRERNAWAVFEEASGVVRRFIGALSPDGQVTPSRIGPDLRALIEGSANVALRFGTPAGPETFGPPPRPGAEPGARPRVKPGIRLVLSQPPIHWSPENVAFAYLATSLALGAEAAATLPLGAIFGSATRSGWARDAATLQRALTAVRPVLLPDAKVVMLLDDAGPEGLVSTVIGGVGAGLRVDDAVLGDSAGSLDGTVQFTLPRAVPGSDRDVAMRSSSDPAGPFQIAAVEAAIADIAVAVIQLRGEPTRFDRILGEVLLGLDHLGHLRRLVGIRVASESDRGEGPEQQATGLWGELDGPLPMETDEDTEDGELTLDDDAVSEPNVDPAAPQLPWDDIGPVSDPVRLTLEMIRKEMQREAHPRLIEVDEDLWWLRDPRDLAAIKPPLAERVEWGIFSLLSTGGGITDASFQDRLRRLYRGPETADQELIEACLTSYRRPGPADDELIHTDDSLQRRYREHGEIVGVLTEFAHRMGMRAWISKREQRRRYKGATLGDLLSDPEQRVYLPLVAPGPPEVLEEIDCIWYVRGRGAFLFDVEWMAAMDEPIRQRGPRIDTSESLVRFLVVPDERAPLVRLRLARSPLLRRRMEADNWHILKWSHVRRLPTSKRADLSVLSPLMGLDPSIENDADQMALFG